MSTKDTNPAAVAIWRFQGGTSGRSPPGNRPAAPPWTAAPQRRGAQLQTDKENGYGRTSKPDRPARRKAMTRIRMGLVPGLLLVLALAVAACGGGGGKSDGVASLGDGEATATTTSPGGSSDPQQAALAYAKCMRQHGINMPDPKIDANEGVGSVLPEGVSPEDPKFKAAQEACKQYTPGGGQPPKLSPQQQQQLVAFARCMRQHGIDMPDPEPGGGLDLRGVDSDTPKFQAAQQACQKYTPNGAKQSSNGGSK
jgi:hypothetical protein